MAKVHELKFRLGLRPNPARGAYDAPAYLLVGWGEEHPSQTPPPQRLRRLTCLLGFPKFFFHNLSTGSNDANSFECRQTAEVITAPITTDCIAAQQLRH